MDIRGKILEKYAIDINDTKQNIIKLYKIDNPDISEAELDKKISETRKRWNQSVNGANEKNAQRDRKRLDNADKYETILKDASLRKALFEYYQGGNKSGDSNGYSENDVEFAKEYFKIVATSKTIKKDDVDFFFDYYTEQKKNKKSICEMLTKEFKIKLSSKDTADDDTDEADNVEGKKKGKGPLVVNLFSKATILKLGKCQKLYIETISNSEITDKYPVLQDGLYEFLNMKNIENIKVFSQYVNDKAKEVYAVRQEKGNSYIPLVDILNEFKKMCEYADVVDNFAEFKLLVRYPSLSPYMYSFVEMKPSTLKKFEKVASDEYDFMNETDFILNYYDPVHDNFGITDSGISGIIKKAKKGAAKNKILKTIDEKIGFKGQQAVWQVNVIHALLYCPMFLLCFIFEITKTAVKWLHKLSVPVFIVLAGFLNIEEGLTDGISIFNLIKLGNSEKWKTLILNFYGYDNLNNMTETIILSTLYIILLATLCIGLPLLVTITMRSFSENMNKRYDWIGYERTLKNIMKALKIKTINQYDVYKKELWKKSLPQILLNVFGVLIVIGVIVALIIIC